MPLPLSKMSEKHHYGNKKIEETDSVNSKFLKEKTHYDTSNPAPIPSNEDENHL